jgi:hypothetical protein
MRCASIVPSCVELAGRYLYRIRRAYTSPAAD